MAPPYQAEPPKAHRASNLTMGDLGGRVRAIDFSLSASFDETEMGPLRPSFSNGPPACASHYTTYLKDGKTSISKDNNNKISMNIKIIKIS